jgi:hypothetical protein
VLERVVMHLGQDPRLTRKQTVRDTAALRSTYPLACIQLPNLAVPSLPSPLLPSSKLTGQRVSPSRKTETSQQLL